MLTSIPVNALFDKRFANVCP